MSTIIPRTCTEISTGDTEPYQDKEPQSLEAFREAPAYVLLGDPGAGKTTAFAAECEALGEEACLIAARDFLTFDPQNRPEWRGKTLFIDGLDEVRAGSSDARTSFDAIRGRLDTLGKPRFRLSCRAADWLGANDRGRLEAVSPNAKVTVLRLDPLADSDIAQLLATHPRVDDAEAFVAGANERGIGDLLANPQTLELLVNAVTGGSWPESRQETFEMACGQMVQEHNEEHQAAASTSSDLPTSAQLLDAAGRLCVVQLIAGVAGYTRHGQPDNEYPALDEYGGDHPDRLRLALTTKLFKGVSDNRFTPVHRHVAEFLGARCFARIIDSGLPARRVIALMTGADGGVVTELRGLSAWLAVHCQDARTDLIERDPIGVGLYGDIRGFLLDEKRKLLASLEREGSQVDPLSDPQNDFQVDTFRERAMAFGTLATFDMEPALREVLQDSNRDPDHQIFTDFILRILEQGTPLPCLSEMLLDIVRDDTRWPRVKQSALHAFIHNCPDSQDKVSKLKALLADIQTGGVSDSDLDMLFGTLLIELYPDEVTPSEIWSCFAEREDPQPFGKLWWLERIVNASSDEQAAEFLDDLQQRFAELRPVLELHHQGSLLLSLLARGLRTHGDQLGPSRLYDWLGVGEIGYGTTMAWWDNGEDTDEDTDAVRSWLAQRPEVQKAVIMEGLDRCSDADDFRFQAFGVQRRLYHSSLPPDFGHWCLEQAVAKANTEPRVAEHLVEVAFRHSGSGDLSLVVLRKHAQKNGRLKATLDRLLASQLRTEEQELEHQEWERTFTEERLRREEERLAWIRSNEAALRDNCAPLALLHQLAQVYFGDDLTNNGPKAIEEVLRGDQHLTRAVLQGLRGAVDRRDVPAFEDILSLPRGRMHYLAWPFLAGLMEIERTAPEDASRWDDDRIRKALAFHYGVSFPNDQPEWYQRLIAAHPEVVAEVWVQCTLSSFRGGHEYIYKLAQLVRDSDHAQIASQASLPLLHAFPIRCKQEQVRALIPLLWAAIRHTDRPVFLDLIERKLTRTSMDVGQRVCWLAAGALVSPTAYRARLENFVQGQERRTLHLAEFLQGVPDRFLIGTLGIPQLECLIRLIGRYINPVDIMDARLHTSELIQGMLLKELIQDLAASPDKAASDALASLLADPSLSAWRDVLSQTRDAQRVIRRDADYRHPTIEQVCHTLKGGAPANPGDLAALVLDRLEELAAQIRRGNTDDWRQYWNLDAHGRPKEPRPENSCRDALLSDLRQRLPQGVDAQPEGQYANDKRADIRVSYGGFQVPVEIKKNSHPKLWSALQDQLIAQYASDPETDGYGIYLVFWFGEMDGHRTQPSPSGKRPVDAEELKKRLEGTLSPEEARKIAVCVIDVSDVTQP